MGFATESWLLLPPQIHSEGPVLFVSPQIILSFGTTCTLPQLKPTNQPNKQAVLPCLGQSYNHFFFFMLFNF